MRISRRRANEIANAVAHSLVERAKSGDIPLLRTGEPQDRFRCDSNPNIEPKTQDPIPNTSQDRDQ